MRYVAEPPFGANAARLLRLRRRGASRTPLRALHGAVLESVAGGHPLDQTLAQLCRLAQSQAPAATWSIVQPAGANGNGSGACGAAQDHWSAPVVDGSGQPLAHVVLRFEAPRATTGWERRLAESCVHLARLAIEHDGVRQNLQLSNERFHVALSNLSQGVCFFDGSSRLIVANRRYCELYSLPHGSIGPGTTLQEIVAMRVAAGSGPTMKAAGYLGWRTNLHTNPNPSDTTLELENGRIIAIHHQPMPDGGWVATHEDVTERCRAEAQVVHLARHDALTGLPNRTTFGERMEQALAYVVRGQGCAVLCLDLDRFKAVNDSLGHPAGDALLKGVAERLLACVREVDTVTRLGGDEFAVLLVGLDGPQRAAEVAERIIRAFREPFALEGHSLVAFISIGIAVALQDGATPGSLLKSADTALYRAKTDARGGYRFFEPEMDAQRQLRVAMERDLREAIATEAFELAYQPVMDLRSREITGFEALLRWPHPVRGLVPPNEFIPVAEETGLIITLGEWALQRACAEAAQWSRPVRLAVNLAPAQFRQGTLVAAVQRALAVSGLDPRRLELDVTESLLLRNPKETLATLHELRALGVNVALDDFGTGASSLHYLRSFPFAKIKIDQSFVRELSDQPDSIAVVRAIVGLGRSLEMVTLAEGVETEAQFAQLRDEGCGEVQGFLFSRAVEAAAARALLGGA